MRKKADCQHLYVDLERICDQTGQWWVVVVCDQCEKPFKKAKIQNPHAWIELKTLEWEEITDDQV